MGMLLASPPLGIITNTTMWSHLCDALQVYLEEDSRSYLERTSSTATELSPKKAKSWQRVCQLLSRKQDRIEPVKALMLLPGEVRIGSFLCVCACHVNRKLIAVLT